MWYGNEGHIHGKSEIEGIVLAQYDLVIFNRNLSTTPHLTKTSTSASHSHSQPPTPQPSWASDWPCMTGLPSC